MIDLQCFECDGKYEEVRIDYNLDTPYGKLQVPDVGVLVCNKCEDSCLDDDNTAKLDEAFEILKRSKINHDEG